jgi:hypothetical protein
MNEGVNIPPRGQIKFHPWGPVVGGVNIFKSTIWTFNILSFDILLFDILLFDILLFDIVDFNKILQCTFLIYCVLRGYTEPVKAN